MHPPNFFFFFPPFSFLLGGLIALRVYNDSLWLANLKRMTVVGGER